MRRSETASQTGPGRRLLVVCHPASRSGRRHATARERSTVRLRSSAVTASFRPPHTRQRCPGRPGRRSSSATHVRGPSRSPTLMGLTSARVGTRSEGVSIRGPDQNEGSASAKCGMTPTSTTPRSRQTLHCASIPTIRERSARGRCPNRVPGERQLIAKHTHYLIASGMMEQRERCAELSAARCSDRNGESAKCQI